MMCTERNKIKTNMIIKQQQLQHSESAYLYEGESRLDPESGFGLRMYFQNLMGPSLSKDTSMIKLS